jgi:hypothetical protein
VPGRSECYHLDPHTFVGRVFGALYDNLFCPDPCYQPRWIPEANAGFFLDWARPQTIFRIRYDDGENLVLADRATFFWARADGKGLGPSPPKIPKSGTHTTPSTGATHRTRAHVPHVPAARPPGLTGPIAGAPSPRPPGIGPTPTPPAHHVTHTAAVSRAHPLAGQTSFRGPLGLDYHDLSLYQEAATERASFFVEIPYRLVEPTLLPSHAGFADMNLGTKALWLDTDLLQITFQFRTYLPIGNFGKGIGNGHVSLEPSILTTLRLAHATYLQGQLAEWIPLGGDPQFSGSLLHYHLSLNQVLYRLTPDSPLIGTVEFNGWSFQGGDYSDPYFGPRRASGFSYFSLGPGLRWAFAQQYDIGLGTAFALTDPHFASSLYRLEFRIRF